MSTIDRTVSEQTEALYLDHHGWLKSWLWRRLGCPERASDFAQETFFRVLTRPKSELLDEPRAFLTCIATRLIIDDSRRAKLERAWRESQVLQNVEQSSVPSTEEIVEFLDALESIARLLQDLAERPRKAFMMYRLDGMAQAEIATELGVSVSMVKKYVAQGLLHCHLGLAKLNNQKVKDIE